MKGMPRDVKERERKIILKKNGRTTKRKPRKRLRRAAARPSNFLNLYLGFFLSGFSLLFFK